jgi:hypothetical protein
MGAPDVLKLAVSRAIVTRPRANGNMKTPMQDGMNRIHDPQPHDAVS